MTFPRRRVVFSVLVWWGLGAGFVACGSDEGLPAGGSDAGPEDAGTLPAQEASTEASADAAAPDASVTAPQLRSGFELTCSVAADGAASCWGNGKASPTPLAPGTRFRSVEPGSRPTRACAIRDDGALLCWDPKTFAPAVKDARPFASVSVGDDYACAITKGGQLFCWGANNPYGRLGTGNAASTETLTAVGTDSDWQSVRAGRDHTCAIKTNGALYCWGLNSSNQLGDGAGGSDGGPIYRATPVPVAPGTAFREVALGVRNTCAVRSDGALLCWGSDLISVTTFATTPKEIDAARDWSSVRMEYQHACARKTTGTIHCWGRTTYGELGDGTYDAHALPVQVGTDRDWIDVDVGTFVSCGKKTDGSARCWGHNNGGALGNAAGMHMVPTRVSPGEQFKYVAASISRGMCAVTKAGALHCWGSTIVGGQRQLPEAVDSPITTWDSVAMGGNHACARQTNDAVSCWGANSEGESGLPAGGNLVAKPTAIGFTAQSIFAGVNHSCALSSGKLYCWGYNPNGQVLPGSATTGITSPTKVSDDDWLDVSAGQYATCGIRSNHELWCFGQGFTSPMQRVDADVTWTKAAGAGANVYFALKSGVLNLLMAGQAPTSYPGTNYVSASSRGSFHCGIRADGSLWCGGGNAEGQLGDGTTIDRAQPVQVGTNADWTMVVTSTQHACGLRNGGELYCWGSNGAGEVGDGTAWSPTPVVVK
jgi:alpha-tubulin suppressor-like RCC1 family protein